MTRIRNSSLAWSAILLVALAGTAFATPLPNDVFINERTFNDCPLSTLTVNESYPASIEITDEMSNLCVGFANLHGWSFSTDGGGSAALFANASSFRFSADVTISGLGEGEGGLRLAPWWAPFVDGRFMLNATTGEIAVFGGRLPFYSFTANHAITYTRGTTVRLEIETHANDNTAASPATIQYRVIDGVNTYASPVFSLDMANPAEDPPYGLWGILNEARVGGYFQPRANTGQALTAEWENVEYTVLDPTPEPNAASIETRTFNDCGLSTLTVNNNYPAQIDITDEMSNLCVGFANLHTWSFSEDGGVSAAVFSNGSTFSFSADVNISGAGEGEGGLRLAPWWAPFVDGRFMLNVTTGEVAVFGGRLPFYSFTGNHGVTYVRGTTATLGMTYLPNSLSSSDPGTVQYRMTYNGNTYESPVLAFDMANPNEDPPYGLWGILNGARAGGYFQPRANTGAALTATWSNIQFSSCPVAVQVSMRPRSLNLKSSGQFVMVSIEPSAPYTPQDIDISSITLNGSVAVAPNAPVVYDDFDGDGIPDVTVRFLRSEVAAVLGAGPAVPVTVSGSIAGDCFRGTDAIKVKSVTLPAPVAGQVVSFGESVDIAWEPDAGVSTVSIISTWDGGNTWQLVAEDVANTGSYSWTAPMDVATSQARIGVVQIRSLDEYGYIADAELGESATFSLTSALGVGNGALSFALRGITPNPARGAFSVSFALPSNRPATLAVFDISGRQVAERAVGGLGAGQHTVSFAKGMKPGLYLVRLTQAGQVLNGRVAVIQ